ncbi:MAG TPA: hypothetical protein DDW45_08790 [Gammaproteobacteria bacterium]|nr:hypothetical protein [Gammaproteobacteria bacterium]
MRITARLDAESKNYLETIQKKKGLKTVTDVLKYSLREAANHLQNQAKPGDKMKALLASDFVGSFDGEEDLSVNYKQYVAEYLDEKYPQHPEVAK